MKTKSILSLASQARRSQALADENLEKINKNKLLQAWIDAKFLYAMEIVRGERVEDLEISRFLDEIILENMGD